MIQLCTSLEHGVKYASEDVFNRVFFFSVHVGVYMIHFLTPNSYAVTTKIVFACIKKKTKQKKTLGQTCLLLQQDEIMHDYRQTYMNQSGL